MKDQPQIPTLLRLLPPNLPTISISLRASLAKYLSWSAVLQYVSSPTSGREGMFLVDSQSGDC